MEQIKDTIRQLVQAWETSKERFPAQDPEQWLKKILTKKELKHIKINYFRKGVLGVNVDSSPWFYALSVRKAEVLGKLRQHCDSVKDIHFRVGELK